MKQSAVIATQAEEFATFLKAGRRELSLSVAEIARITKIPPRSLASLEAGEFDTLPADVFVRGFVKSYAQCVGLDPDEAIRLYTSARAPRCIDTDDRTASRVDLLPKPAQREVRTDEQTPLTRAGDFFARSFLDRSEPQASRRGTVTLAVIILVIVAAFTVSYLLRRPSRAGDEVTRVDTVQKLLA